MSVMRFARYACNWEHPRASAGCHLEEPPAQLPAQLVPLVDPRARLLPQRLGVNRSRVGVAAVVVDPALEIAARDLGVELDSPRDGADPEGLQEALAARQRGRARRQRELVAVP